MTPSRKKTSKTTKADSSFLSLPFLSPLQEATAPTETSTDNTDEPKDKLDWKWRIAYRLAQTKRRTAERNLLTGQMLDTYAPALETPRDITASLAISALADAIKEHNQITKDNQRQHRSLIESIVQFCVVLLILLSVSLAFGVRWGLNAAGDLLDFPGSEMLLDRFLRFSLPSSPEAEPNAVAFQALGIATSYLYDESPPGAWDFTLYNPNTDSTTVDFPAPCPGVIDEVGVTDRAGKYLWFSCNDGDQWFIAHLSTIYVDLDERFKPGQALAQQGSTGNSTGDHIHAVIDPKNGARWDRKKTKPILDKAFAFWQKGLTKGDLQATALPAQAVDLVKTLEGLHLTAYPDGTAPDGQARWSIGYGTPSKPGEVITETEAKRRLAAHLAVAHHRVNDLVTVPLTPDQQAALISFEYNTGGLAGSKLLAHLNQGDFNQAANQFEAWVYWLPHGKISLEVAPGLVTRREKEKHLFLS